MARDTRYDRAARRALLTAIRGHQMNPARPRAAAIFVSSPPNEFRFPDAGGLTESERAFTRSAYYQVYRVPKLEGRNPDWSLKMTWGKIEKRGSRWGRTARLRLFRYRQGYAYAQRRGQQWSAPESPHRSLPGRRIDEGRSIA